MAVQASVGNGWVCAEWERLLGRFLSTVEDLIALETQKQEAASVRRRAERKKAIAKHALLLHLKKHKSCGTEEGNTA